MRVLSGDSMAACWPSTSMRDSQPGAHAASRRSAGSTAFGTASPAAVETRGTHLGAKLARMRTSQRCSRGRDRGASTDRLLGRCAHRGGGRARTCRASRSGGFRPAPTSAIAATGSTTWIGVGQRPASRSAPSRADGKAMTFAGGRRRRLVRRRHGAQERGAQVRPGGPARHPAGHDEPRHLHVAVRHQRRLQPVPGAPAQRAHGPVHRHHRVRSHPRSDRHGWPAIWPGCSTRCSIPMPAATSRSRRRSWRLLAGVSRQIANKSAASSWKRPGCSSPGARRHHGLSMWSSWPRFERLTRPARSVRLDQAIDSARCKCLKYSRYPSLSVNIRVEAAAYLWLVVPVS